MLDQTDVLVAQCLQRSYMSSDDGGLDLVQHDHNNFVHFFLSIIVFLAFKNLLEMLALSDFFVAAACTFKGSKSAGAFKGALSKFLLHFQSSVTTVQSSDAL
jgi:hypothetical protein